MTSSINIANRTKHGSAILRMVQMWVQRTRQFSNARTGIMRDCALKGDPQKIGSCWQTCNSLEAVGRLSGATFRSWRTQSLAACEMEGHGGV